MILRHLHYSLVKSQALASVALPRLQNQHCLEGQSHASKPTLSESPGALDVDTLLSPQPAVISIPRSTV